MGIELRDYQSLAHQKIIEKLREKKKTLLVMPTGAGKSITMVSFVDRYKAFYKFVLVVRTRNLVFQLQKDLILFGLDHTVLMAGEKADLSKRIILCSKDTMEARNLFPFEGEDEVAVIYDEADENKDFQHKLIEQYGKSKRFFYIGMTATPYNGLDQFDDYVEPITALELNKRKVLVDYNYFIPKLVDYSDVKIQKGEFNQKQVFKKFDSPSAIAESFNQWLNFGDNRQTLIFNCNVAHSKNTVEYINSYFKKELAVHIDADTTFEERKRARALFDRGEIRFLSNVRLFTRGTDIPLIGTILDQAPTLSENLHIQKIGRGSRKNEIYTDLNLIDVANNCLNNGHFYQKRAINLSGVKLKTKADLGFEMKRCEKCFKGYVGDNYCPYCGHRHAVVKPKPLSKAQKEKLFMESASPEAIEQRQMIKYFKKQLWKYQNLGKRYAYNMAKKKAQQDVINVYGRDKAMKIRRSIGL